MNIIIGVCGLGVVGSAVTNCFEKKEVNMVKYDKYKNGGIGNIESLLQTDILFLCLPTLYSEEKKEYDKSSLAEVCKYLSENKYQGIAVIKSTIEPGTCRSFQEKYKLNILHNPEFLSARTAEEDFEHQKHIVIGGMNLEDKNIKILTDFYFKYWNNIISTAIYEETELMKIGVNCFYATKIQFFNELFALTNKYEGARYNNVVEMMLRNNWISPMHVEVPGTDGKLSYGGMCFPKDTNALYQLMLKKGTPCEVLGSTISERNKMRNE